MSTVLKISAFLALPEAQNRDQFLATYKHPFLLCERIADRPASEAKKDFHTTAGISMFNSIAKQEPEVHPVARREGGEAMIITIGRAPNSDIVLADASVSKMHAYFHKDAVKGEYSVTDVGSSNGTKLNGVALVPDGTTPIKDGDELVIAECFRCLFMMPDTLLRMRRP